MQDSGRTGVSGRHPKQKMSSSPKSLGRSGCETSHAVAAKELIAMPDFFLSFEFGEHKLQLNSLLVAVRAACACFEKDINTSQVPLVFD